MSTYLITATTRVDGLRGRNDFWVDTDHRHILGPFVSYGLACHALAAYLGENR